MTTNTKSLTTLFLLLSLLCSCTRQAPRFVIGISQCSADIWREKQNDEMRMAAYSHKDIELRFASAYDSDERQVQQIDSLLATGIDLLIVAPNQVQTITPAIDRAYDSGIPVIVFERKTNSRKYTAFMSADNYEMGRVMGEHIATQLHGKGHVLEVKGLKGSSPAIERHKGFMDALSGYPSITIVDTLQGDWTEQSAYDAMARWLSNHADTPIDYVFGQNDRMAMGARRAVANAQRSTLNATLYCGIDGLPGENGGIRLVRDSILDASYIYPTYGDRLLQQALDILEGKPYDKEVKMMSAIVTRDNADVLLMQSDEIMHQTAYLEQLHQQADSYLKQLDAQRISTWLSGGLILLLLLFIVFIYYYFLQKARLAQERTRLEREQLDFYTQVSHELRTPLTLIEGPLAQLAETRDIQEASPEAAGMFDIVRRNTHQLTALVSKMLDQQHTKEPPRNETLQLSESTLPSAAPATADVPADTTDENTAATLLIVDDNADIRTYLRTILQGRYQLLEAADGQEGLKTAREQVPDLIVSDVMMPVMNGLEFCQQVKDDMATSHIPVILLTARALNQHQIEGYRSGADAYITKPFQADLLLARIENLLHSRLRLKSLFGSAEPAQKTAAEEPQDPFIDKFRSVVEAHMSNSELSVEEISAEMGLSRVQLYRKVKALTGQTPNEQLRKARLIRGKKLLATTDLTISEVAYQVGFTAPSYFTKCFKDEFGVLPGEARKD